MAIVGIAGCVYMLTAYFSTGFHNADEHFQIIEFANYKLGLAQHEDLAWEFDARLRSGIQPALCFLLFKFLMFFGVQDVYVLAFVLRSVTGLLAIWLILRFVRTSAQHIDPKYHTVYLLLSYFLWFLPFVNVRFSSETWSGLFLFAGLTVIQQDRFTAKKDMLNLGVLLSLSVLFRYQMAIAVLGIVSWLLFIGKTRVANLVILGVAGLLVMVGGFFIDSWLYGEYSFTVYNYFHANIIEEVASQYGVSPWYEIFFYLVRDPGPWGIFIFTSLIILLIKRPTHIILWVSLPFLFVHAVIPHKELRFFFPLVNLVPLLLVTAYIQVAGRFSTPKFKRLCLIVLSLLVLANTFGIWVVATKGAGNAKISAAKYIHDHYRDRPVNIIHLRGKNPYADWPVPRNTFYSNNNVTLTEIVTVWQDNILDQKIPGYTNLVVLSNNEITGPRTLQRLDGVGLKKVYQTISWPSKHILNLYKPAMSDDNLMLYEFRR